MKHTKKWTTKEGVKIRVCDMTMRQLNAAITSIVNACKTAFNYGCEPTWEDMIEERSLRRRMADHQAHCEQLMKDNARASKRRKK